MLYSEITVKTNRESAELVAYFLEEVCMDGGVSIYDIKDLLDNPSWDYKDDVAEKPYDKEVLVKGYCETEDTDGVLDFLRKKFATLTNAGSLSMSVRSVDGDSWVDKWKETFKPIETEKIVICPEWQQVTTDKKVLLLDTGIAFGTGQHETTSMCLAFAEQLPLGGKRVLDVGCGSGILGLSALLLGAECAELVDIDPQAVDIARHNAEINGLTAKCKIHAGNLTEQTNGKFDVVFANLTADILAGLYEDIATVVDSGATVVLSGILDIKLHYVKEMYGKTFDIVEEKSLGEWRALHLTAK